MYGGEEFDRGSYLKSILHKKILNILLTQKFAEIAPANQGQVTGADSANFGVIRILSMFLFKMDFTSSKVILCTTSTNLRNEAVKLCFMMHHELHYLLQFVCNFLESRWPSSLHHPQAI